VRALVWHRRRRGGAAGAPGASALGGWGEVPIAGVFLPVQSTESVAVLKQTLREAIGDVWGQDNIPESMEGFHAHITLAYSNSAGSAEPIRAAIKEYDPASVQVMIQEVFLIDLNRDSKRYEWNEVAVVRLGQ